ncbi:MAG: anhydro-N-acetylmuramic acid kinase [Candidatus Gastranaerophilales bacterium]|nr:anhydro-N-acetylmuramic acid kinase [Candidatus Gastranaerophilales bacterium]
MKSYKTIISMMSGTSIDSIDACLVRIFDDLSFRILDSISLEYPAEIKEKLYNLANNAGSVKDVCYMNFITGELFSIAANKLIEHSGLKKEHIDFISSHGQTICHLPEKITTGGITTASTLQIGDISVISQKTGILTIGDFRTKDIAAGGQGAPLVPFADKILFGLEKNRLIQNIGGISNVTVLSKDCEIFAFDNAPGNMLIDYFMNKLFSLPYDKNGEIAAMGKVDDKWLKKLLEEPYYSKNPPKTTGRELFNSDYAEQIQLSAPKNRYDIISTITELTALAITESYKKFILPKTKIDEVVLGGGGAYNLTLIKRIQDYIPQIKVKTHEDFNIPNKLKEAIAFAYLGYYAYQGKANNVPSCTGADCPVVMGKFSY